MSPRSDFGPVLEKHLDVVGPVQLLTNGLHASPETVARADTCILVVDVDPAPVLWFLMIHKVP